LVFVKWEVCGEEGDRKGRRRSSLRLKNQRWISELSFDDSPGWEG
jgi:hypothetical protein